LGPVSETADAYEVALPCVGETGRRASVPLIQTYVERADGQLKSVYAIADTGAGISVFDGRVAIALLQLDPRRTPLGVVPLAGFTGGAGATGYVHELSCYFGAYARFARLTLHVAFTDPDDAPLVFNVLGREGLNGTPNGGFFSQVQFGYRHRPPHGTPEVYITFAP
jgi:hypothetical protein